MTRLMKSLLGSSGYSNTMTSPRCGSRSAESFIGERDVSAVDEFVHKKMVADLQGIFHGA